MSSMLPSRRFREVQLLIGVALVLLVAVAVAQLQGIVAVGGAAVEAERRAAASVARIAARSAAAEDLAIGGAEGASFLVRTAAGVVRREGDPGPSTPAWWPWPSAAEWERSGRAVAGPLEHNGRQVVVAYQPTDEGGTVRVVLPVETVAAASRWRWVAAALTLVVAGGGALLAWILLGRSLAPYRELLEEASRVRAGTPGTAEDRFLVDTFRETVRRLEASEEELRRRADELEVLAGVLTRGAASGVVILDGDGRVRASNAAVADLLGAATALGAPLPELTTSAEGTVEVGGRTLELRRHPLLAVDGRPQGEVVFVNDRSRERALERALQEREGMAALGELAAGMAHELRNALATIVGYLRLLPAATQVDATRYVEAMRQEAETLAQVLDRFLGFAQPRELKRQPFELGGLVRERVLALGESTDRHLELSVEDGVEVVGDRLAVAVALDNLLRNAVEAVEAGRGGVAVSVRRTSDGAEVAIDDEGPGVPPEIRERLFVPFATSKPSGGLGLALARRLARLHGGDVEYRPRSEGGSSFRLRLPVEVAT